MGFFTADLCDKYDDKVQVLGSGFISYGGLQKCSGKIATCKLIDNNEELIKLLKSAGKNRIAVVDVEGKYVAVVGDKLMAFAKKNNWSGIVVNGYIRDTNTLKEINVGLWALGTCPKKAPIPNDGFLDVPLNFAGVEFVSDDYLYADSDGIITSKSQLTM